VRRVLLLVSAIMLVDTSFYAAITPLLPYYADKLELTKAAAGILAAAYPAGTLLAALPCGWAAARLGAERMLLLGLALLAVSSVTFGLAQDLWLLDAARFAQGIAGAASWTGGLAWLSGTAPRERRTEVMATAFGAAMGGALLGPVIGAAARGVGTGPAFGGVAVLAVVLAGFTLRERARTPRGPALALEGGFGLAFRERLIARGAWLVGLSALLFGVLEVLLPLKMGRLGAAGGVIAAVFLVSAGLEAAISRRAGRYADRHGWRPIARFGLLGTAAVALVASLPNSVALLAVVGIVAGPLVGVLWIPGLALLSEGSDRAGIDHSYAFAVLNLMWAGAQAVGSGGGGALAGVASDFAPYALVALAALGTAFVVLRPRRAHDARPA
jgi:MFS family permease